MVYSAYPSGYAPNTNRYQQSTRLNMRLLIATFFLLATLKGTCQLRCGDVVDRLEPDPYELLNDSISHFATAKQIDQLIEEHMLLFSFNFNLQTQKIDHLQLNYFKEIALFDKVEPLDPELIKRLEDFFKQNLRVIINPEYPKDEHDVTIECAFLTHIKKK